METMNENLLSRFTLEQTQKIQVFLSELAFRTRKSKRISNSRQLNIIAEWADFDTETVESAIDIFLKMPTTPAQNEKYVKGIMRNIQKEREAAGHEGYRNGHVTSKSGTRSKEYGRAAGILEDEGERLRKLSEGRNSEEIWCDF